uniref:Pyridoxal 5'-phosphate synthase n=1 Tax=Macrostomum lignano TaxID=282301 RepID=A0A1I8F6J8_9PLAT
LGNGRRPIPLTSLREVAVTPPPSAVRTLASSPLDNGHADAPANALDCFVTWLARQRQTEAAGFSNCIRTVREPCDFNRPIVGRFGFYVAKESRGDLVLTRFHDPAAQQRCRGLLHPATESSSWRATRPVSWGWRHSARLAHRRVCGFELFAVERTSLGDCTTTTE